MDTESLLVTSLTFSLPCDFMRRCLKQSKGCIQDWVGESPEITGTFPITTVLRKPENCVEFSLNELSIVCSQSIHLNVSKVKKPQKNPEVNPEILIKANESLNTADIENTDFIMTEPDGLTSNENSAVNQEAAFVMDTCSQQDFQQPEYADQENNPEEEKPKVQRRKRKSKYDTLPDEIVDICEEQKDGKRYSLRGVKLSSVIMEAVKKRGNIDDTMESEEEIIDEDADDDYEVNYVNTSNTEAQTEYDIDEDSSKQNENRFKIKKRSNVKGSIKMFKKFKESYLTKEVGMDATPILATIGNVYSKERRKKNIDKAVACKYCGKCFCDYTGVDTHVKKYHKNEKDVDEYIEELIPLKQVACSVCNQQFPSRLQLQVHEDRHHSKTLVVCSICGKVFKNLQFLRNHIKLLHLKDKSHLCHFCSSKFKHAVTLKQHIEEIHEKRRNVKCPDCGKLFYRQSQLNRHSRIHSTNGKKIVCQVCGRGFNFECNLQRHLSVVHNPKSEKFHCSYCGKGFNQKSTLNAHVLKLHYNLCPFVCKICQLPFMRSKQIEDHMAQAHNEKDFKIENPREKLFKYNRASDDMFSCSYCENTFCFKAQLVDHVQVDHLNIFPFRCEKCQHGFLEKGYLLRHQEKAHDLEPESLIDEDQQILETITDSHGNSKQITVVPLTMTVSTGSNGSNLQDDVLTIDQSETVTEIDPENHEAASVLVEISNEDNTIQYVIQGGENMVMDSSSGVVHDIASLLLAAEQSLQENTGSVTLTTVESDDVAAASDVTQAIPNVITISNTSQENTDIACIEEVQEMTDDSQMEEITVIMKE